MTDLMKNQWYTGEIKMTLLIVGILVWSGIFIVMIGSLVAFNYNFIIASIIIGMGFFSIIFGIVINNNEIIAEELEKHGY